MSNIPIPQFGHARKSLCQLRSQFRQHILQFLVGLPTNIYKLTAQTSEVDFVAEGLQMAHEVRMKLRALCVALEWT